MASMAPKVMQTTVPATQSQVAAHTQATTQAVIQTKFSAAAITSIPHPPRPVGSRYNFTNAFALNGLSSDGNLLFAARHNISCWPISVKSAPDDLDGVASMTLQAFPRGYKLWVHGYYEVDGTKKRRDKFLYGHASSQPFRSLAKFYSALDMVDSKTFASGSVEESMHLGAREEMGEWA